MVLMLRRSAWAEEIMRAICLEFSEIFIDKRGGSVMQRAQAEARKQVLPLTNFRRFACLEELDQVAEASAG